MSLDLTTLSWNIFDADDGGGDATLRVQVTEGTLDCTVGNSGVVITSGDVSSNILLTGTITEFNNFLNDRTTGTLIYATSVAGVKTFTITLTDSDGLVGTNTFTAEAFTFANPILVPGSTTQVDLGFSHSITGWSVSDPDDENIPGTMTLGITNGALTVSPGNTGVQIVSGNGTTLVTLSGTFTAFTALLSGSGSGTISYVGASTGSKTFTVHVTDSESGTDTDTSSVVVGTRPVVTAPTIINSIQSTNKNLEGLGFSVSDADDAGGTATCVIATTVGTIDITVGNSGVTITGGDTTATVTFTGTITQIKNLLDDTSTGTMILSPGASVTTGTITVTVTDSTSRAGSNSAPLEVASSTPTWRGYAQATPVPPLSLNCPNAVALIDLSLLPTTWWALVTADGRDIRVTDNANVLRPRDLIHFDRTARTGLLAIKHTIISGSTLPVRVWAGAGNSTAPSVSDTYGQYNTYISTIRGFWPDGAGNDRTSYLNHMTAQNGLVAGDSAGPFSLGTHYNGTTQYASTSVSLMTALPIEFLAYAKFDSLAGSATVMNFHNTGDTISQCISFASTNQLNAYAQVGNTGASATALGNLLSGNWHSINGQFLATNFARRSCRDGGNQGVNATIVNTTFTAGQVRLYLGASRAGTGAGTANTISAYLPGTLSMVMLTALRDDTTPSGAALNVVWHSQKNQASFWGSWVFTSTSLTGL